MLENIPKMISPELMKVIMEMGHGDEIVIADGNFLCESSNNRVIRCDGHGVEELLDALLRLFPVESPVLLMNVDDGSSYLPEIWDDYKRVLNKYNSDCHIEFLERHTFYERAEKSYAIVATGELAIFASIVLRKGVVSAEDLSKI
ncbi:RbsD/FucU family protein [Virgibacillus natechei]